MIFDTLTIYEKELILVGFNKMSVSNQNSLVSALAIKYNCALFQVTPDMILKFHKDLKISIINEACEISTVSGFTSTVNGHKYRLNQDDQINFLGKLFFVVVLQPDTAEVKWKTEDADYIIHTKEDWVKIAGEGFAHKETQLMKYNEKHTAISTATTHEQIVSTNW